MTTLPLAAWARRHALPIGIALALAVPLIVACAALYAQDWAPIYDMALIEQRVRDVGTVHTPLVGLPGRLGTTAEPASHPGPLAFFRLAPGYRLFGGSAWALHASAALLNAIAVAAFVFVAWRRQSAAELAAASLGLGLLMLGYGSTLLTEPWNPYFPVLWFATCLMAVWGVVQGDLAMLPVAAVTASAAAQTHIPYLPVCGVLGAIGAVIVMVTAARAPKPSALRRRGLRVLGVTIAILLVAWTPLLVEELRGAPGNITRLVRYFQSPSSVPIGIGPAFLAVISRFDARALVVDPWVAPGGFGDALYPSQPRSASAVTLAIWILCAILAARLRSRLLLTLHAAALACFAVAVLAASRIVGFAYGHVLLWCWALAVLIAVACAATFASQVSQKLPEPLLSRLASLGPALAFTVVALCALRLGWAARQTRPALYAEGRLVRALALETIAALEQRKGLATGRAGRYLVSWSDPLRGSALGISLANEIERAGFDVAYDRGFVLAGTHRTRELGWASARIHLAAGGWIAEGRHAPNAVLASRVDLRTRAEEIEARNLQTELVESLRKAGRQDLVARIPYDLPGTMAAAPRQNVLIGLAVARITEIGWPTAVFIMPPGAVLVRTLTR
jgi:hypothetical protein